MSSKSSTWIVVEVDRLAAGGDIGTITHRGLFHREAVRLSTPVSNRALAPRIYDTDLDCLGIHPCWHSREEAVVGRVVRCTGGSAWPRDELGEREALSRAVQAFDQVYGAEDA